MSLHLAAEMGDLHRIQKLLRQGSSVHYRLEGKAPLHVAAYCGRSDVVLVLLKHGAQINSADPEGYTPLHLACLGFKMDTAALLLQNGADPNCQSRTGSLPLHYLARHHFTENETAEFITAYMEVLHLMVKAGVDINHQNKRGETALLSACARGSTVVVDFLLSNGAEVNLIDDKGRTALHYAIHRGNQGAVGLLLHYGATVNMCTKKRNSCLDLAKRLPSETRKRLIKLLAEEMRNQDVHDDYLLEQTSESMMLQQPKLKEVNIIDNYFGSDSLNGINQYEIKAHENPNNEPKAEDQFVGFSDSDDAEDEEEEYSYQAQLSHSLSHPDEFTIDDRNLYRKPTPSESVSLRTSHLADELPTPLHPRDSHSLSHSGILPRKCITDKSQRQLANSEIISKWFLPGEESVYEMLNAIYVPMNIKERAQTGNIIVTNYRMLFFPCRSLRENGTPEAWYVPLGVMVSCEDIGQLRSVVKGQMATFFALKISCKHFAEITIAGNREEDIVILQDVVETRLSPSILTDFFALSYFEALTSIESDNPYWRLMASTKKRYEAASEYGRLQLDIGLFQISQINHDYQFCSTYPTVFVVPNCITDDELRCVAQFRRRNRIPVVVWAHPQNGSVVARCSQPATGVMRRRCKEDEKLLNAFASSCCNKNLIIYDARPVVQAYANSLAGAGVEGNNYQHCKYEFLNIPNIHIVRREFLRLKRSCIAFQRDAITKPTIADWLEQISLILSGANSIAMSVHSGSSVCVHCSDGWDRTAQLVSLAQLFLDSFYRTIFGFEILIEKEWLSFGHQFYERLGFRPRSSSTREDSPVFLQFIDCVWQYTQQYPTACEFNEHFLFAILEHMYSNRFGTFLFNTERERISANLQNRTACLWKWLDCNYASFLNTRYRPPDQQHSKRTSSSGRTAADPDLRQIIEISEARPAPSLSEPVNVSNPHQLHLDGLPVQDYKLTAESRALSGEPALPSSAQPELKFWRGYYLGSPVHVMHLKSTPTFII